jgi:hypothetical protein
MERRMQRMITRRRTTMTTMETRMSVRTERMTRMKRSHLRMKQTLWMRILTNFITK